jgi:hypothetical protein
VREISAQRPPLAVTDLAIDGGDVIAALIERGVLPAGSRGGPQVGAILQALLERVMDDPSINERGALLELVAEVSPPQV